MTSNDRPPTDRPFPHAPVAIVGAGAVGSALGQRLTDCDVPVCAVINRRRAQAEALAERLGADIAGTDPGQIPDAARTVFLCVPDDAIEPTARRLAEAGRDWAGTLVAHTSGAHTSSLLSPLAEAGGLPLSFHPMQTFTPETPARAFEGIVIGIEGDPAAVEPAERLARRLGARPIVLSAEAKTRYHCAAALASNGLVALMGAVQTVLASAGIEGDDADALLKPLIAETWKNLQDASPEEALTGPAARNDRGTIASHLNVLAEDTPDLVPLYAELTAEMTRIAERSGRLDAKDAEQLRTLLKRPSETG
jgi:predicted short-subunit dehydrogenase-like oxidoreductase (DUF2520 family)